MDEIGRPRPSVDSPAKAAGAIRYLKDISIPGMLHAKMIFPGRPHARIARMSFARTLGAEGVAAVAAADSVPGRNQVGVVVEDQPLFAEDVVRYEADCVAAVAAETPEAAEIAASLAEIELEDLPAAVSLDEARRDGAPRIHVHGNIAVEHTVAKGDLVEGERRSSVIVENVFRTSVQEHAYLETLGAIAIPCFDGSFNILASTQCPYYVRDSVARCLGVAQAKVRVVQTPVGGGFGGKEDVPSEICARAAVLASISGRPVKMTLTREEDIAYSSKRHPMELRYRMGCDAGGRIQFADIEIDADVGAYASLSPIVLFRSTVHAAGPYEIANVRVRARGFYTNAAPRGAMRGFGTPQVVFACEAMVDEMAKRTGLDPVDFRLRNALKTGSATATGQVLEDSVGFPETLSRAREVLGAGEKPFAPRRSGRDLVRAKGVASMIYGVSLGAIGKAIDRGTAKVEILKDGSVAVFIGCTDMGQGALTVVSQIAAARLGIEQARVTVNAVDTAVVGDSGPTVASRATVMSGNAVLDACGKIMERVASVAASLIGEAVTFSEKERRFVGASGAGISVADAVKESHARKIDLSATGWYNPPDCAIDKATGQGKAYYGYSFATDIAEVEVDTRTGHVEVLSVTAIHDSGTIINPLTAASQLEGGAAQGIGFALTERYLAPGGRVATGDFATYLLPTSLDVCEEIVSSFVEQPSRDGPYGAKGLGEPAIIPVAAAIANAVSNALGIRVTALPIDRELLTGGR